MVIMLGGIERVRGLCMDGGVVVGRKGGVVGVCHGEVLELVVELVGFGSVDVQKLALQ